MRTKLTAFTLLVVATGAGHAQRKPRSSGRGVPCGNSYIAPGKVCHVGTAATPKRNPTDSLTDVEKAQIDSALKEHRGFTQASAGAPVATLTPPTVVAASPASANLYDQFLTPLDAMSGKRVVLKNAAIDEKWMRTAWLTQVHNDHLLITTEGSRELRIPISSIEFYYTDPSNPGELVIVLRR